MKNKAKNYAILSVSSALIFSILTIEEERLSHIFNINWEVKNTYYILAPIIIPALIFFKTLLQKDIPVKLSMIINTISIGILIVFVIIIKSRTVIWFDEFSPYVLSTFTPFALSIAYDIIRTIKSEKNEK